ncbi:MAG: hypothetical protein WCD62_22720, partial [Pseudolabrys sp.]
VSEMGRHATGPHHDQYGVDAYPGATQAANCQPARIAPYARLAAHRLGYGRSDYQPSPRAWLANITLEVYGHLFGSADDRASDVIERAFGKVLASENAPENSSGTN